MLEPAPQTGPLRYASYARVSTAGQAEKELSIPAQQRECRAYVTREGGALVQEFADAGISGTTMERPGLQDALSAAKRHEFDVLLIHKLDRLSREELDCLIIIADLKKHGVRLASATEAFVGGEHPMEEAMTGLARTWNKLYVANLRAETRKGLKQAANPTGGPPVPVEHDAPGQGRKGGRAPYGYTFARPGVRGGGWVVDEDTSRWVRYIFDQFADGKMSVEICRQLNGFGVSPPGVISGYTSLPKNGRPGCNPTGWQSSTVLRVISNRLYRGHVSYQGEWYAGQHPAIISVDLWSRAQIARAGRGIGRSEASPALFAGGLLHCPRCWEQGRTSSMHALYPGDGYRNYGCSAATQRAAKDREANPQAAESPSCGGFHISERKVLTLLRAYLADMANLLDDQSVSLASSASAEFADFRSRNVSTQQDALKEALLMERENLPRLRANFQRLAARELMTDEELSANLGGLNERAEAIETELARLNSLQSEPSALTQMEARTCLSLLDDPCLSPLQKRDRLRAVFSFLMPGTDKASLHAYLR